MPDSIPEPSARVLGPPTFHKGTTILERVDTPVTPREDPNDHTGLWKFLWSRDRRVCFMYRLGYGPWHLWGEIAIRVSKAVYDLVGIKLIKD